MASKYPPYVNAYGKIGETLQKIKEASVPSKFTQDYLHTILGLTSSSYRAMIPLLKNLGFLDAGSVPTQVYKDFRDEELSGTVLAKQLKEAYSILYNASEFAHQLSKEQLKSKFKTILGVSDEDSNLPNVVGTFMELVKYAEFDKKAAKKPAPKQMKEENQPIPLGDENQKPQNGNGVGSLGFGISYTINLNLPATTNIEVFNAIFKSLKENLLGNDK